MCFHYEEGLETVKLRTFGQLFRAEEDERTQDHCHIQHLHSLVSLQTLYWLVLEHLSGNTSCWYLCCKQQIL